VHQDHTTWFFGPPHALVSNPWFLVFLRAALASRDKNIFCRDRCVHLACWHGQADLSVFLIGNLACYIVNTDEHDLSNAASLEDHKKYPARICNLEDNHAAVVLASESCGLVSFPGRRGLRRSGTLCPRKESRQSPAVALTLRPGCISTCSILLKVRPARWVSDLVGGYAPDAKVPTQICPARRARTNSMETAPSLLFSLYGARLLVRFPYIAAWQSATSSKLYPSAK
jgi:hypothetical protein